MVGKARSGPVSDHEVRVWRVLSSRYEWLSAADVARSAKVSERTARHHLLRFTLAGVTEVAPLIPHRYRAVRGASAALAESLRLADGVLRSQSAAGGESPGGSQ